MVKYTDIDHDGTIRTFDSEKDGMFWDTLWDIVNWIQGVFIRRNINTTWTVNTFSGGEYYKDSE